MSNVRSNLNELASFEMKSLDFFVSLGTQVSLEAKEESFIDSIKSKFHSFVSMVDTFVSNLKLNHTTAEHLDAEAMLKAFLAQSYSDNRKLFVNVIPGFSGEWVAFQALLIQHILPAAEAAEPSLKTAVSKLAVILNEPDRLKAQSGIRDLQQNLTLVSEENYEKVKSFFKPNSKGQATLNEVADRNQDVETAYKQINELNARLARINFKAIDGLIDRLGSLSAVLTNHISPEQEESQREVAGLVASQLSELFYKLGITLTACSVLLEMTHQQTEVMKTNIAGIAKQLPLVGDAAVHALGIQSTQVRVLASNNWTLVKPLLDRMKKLHDIVERKPEFETVYDRVCDTWYLQDETHPNTALKQFANDIAQLEAIIK